MIITNTPSGVNLESTTATADKIFNGYTAYNGDKEKLTGTALATTTTATAANILSGQTAYNNSGSLITGTMTNQGAKTSSLNCGASYTIPAGYHNGSGEVTANSLASQTSATATAATILSGYTAWVNGSKLTGTLSAGKALANMTFTKTGGFTGTTSSTTTVSESITCPSSGSYLILLVEASGSYHSYTSYGESSLTMYKLINGTLTKLKEHEYGYATYTYLADRDRTIWEPTISGSTMNFSFSASKGWSVVVYQTPW